MRNRCTRNDARQKATLRSYPCLTSGRRIIEHDSLTAGNIIVIHDHLFLLNLFAAIYIYQPK